MKSKKNLILAMETAIEGGSLSISDSVSEIDFWIGTNEISKAEDVLEGLAGLLKKNKLSGADISIVAVSNEVGSATGLKIGLATAKGFAKALGCRLREISLWDALAAEADGRTTQSVVTFLPHGKNSVCYREMRNRKIISETQIASMEDFQKTAERYFESNKVVFAHSKISSQIGLRDFQPLHIQTLANNLATYVTKLGLITNDTSLCQNESQ